LRKRWSGEPDSLVTLVSFGFPSESSLTGVEPCRSGFSRLAVRRLPGLSPVRCRESESTIPRFLSWTFPPLQGLIRVSTALLVQSGEPAWAAGQPPWTSLALQRLQRPRSFATGITRSRQSPPLAFLRFRRTGPQATSNHLSGLFRPDNAPGLSPSGPCSFQGSETRLRARSSLAVGAFRPKPERTRLRRFDPPGKRYPHSRHFSA